MVLHPARHTDDHLRERRQVGTEALEQALELRDNEEQQDHRHDDCDRQHRGGVKQRLLDLLLQRLGLFLVGRDLVEHGLERARVLAGLDQVDVEVVEIERVLGKRDVERVAGLDVRLDGEHELLHRRLVVADADDLERLHHRDAGREHGGELAAEERDVLALDLAVGLEEMPFLADLGDGDPLPPQVGAQLRLVLGQAAALDAIALAVLALPEEGELLACNCLSHVSSASPSIRCLGINPR